VVEEGRQARLETYAALAPVVTLLGSCGSGRSLADRGRPRAYQPDARRQGSPSAPASRRPSAVL